MSSRRPAPPRRPAPRVPSSRRGRRSSAAIPWIWIISISVIFLLVICGSLVLWSRLRDSRQPGQLTSPTSDVVATSVAATVQSVVQATNTHVTTPVSTASPSPDVAPTTTAPITISPNPTLMPAVEVDVQRDTDVDEQTGVKMWTEPASQSELQILFRRADGLPLDKYVVGYQQGADVSGDPVKEGNRVFSNWTGDQGFVIVPVSPGTYVLEANVDGWPWTSQFANHEVVAGQRTSVLFDVSLLTVGIRYASGDPVDVYVKVFLQAQDVSGEMTEGDVVAWAWTGDDGLVTFEVTPGTYALDVESLDGYNNWQRFGHVVPGGGDYEVVLTLGRLSVETWKADGTLDTDVNVRVYELVEDSQGNSVFGDLVARDRSNNTGKAEFDLVPGFYGVQIGRDLEFVDVPVQPGVSVLVNRNGYVLP